VTTRRIALWVVAACLVWAAPARAGVSFDPFKKASSTRAAFDPFRTAQAEPAPSPAPIPGPAAPAASPAPAAPKACTTDDQCPDGTICQNNACQPVQRATNVAWLYYREGSFLEVLGLYWSKRGTTGYTFLAPFYWHTWSPTKQIHVVAPLFWRSEDFAKRSTTTILLPLAAHLSDPDSSFTWVLPLNFGWRNKDHSHQLIFPLFYGSKHPKGGTFASWFGYSAENGPVKHGSVLWLFWWGEDKKANTSYNLLFPFLWDFREGDDRSTVVFPLVWSYQSAGSHSMILGPWLHLQRPTWTFDTVFPVWWSGHDKAATAFKMFIPLFYWRSTDNGRRMAWLSPLGGYSRDDDARSRTLLLWPFLTFWRRDADTSLKVFTPLFVRHRSWAEDSTTTWLGLALFYRRDDPKGSTTAVTPFFWHFRDAQTQATANLFWPFFARRNGPRDTTTAVGLLPFVWAYWRDFKGGGWSGGLFPFAFFGNNAGRSHAMVALLFWRSAGAHDSTTVLAPLFYWHRDPRGTAGGVPALLTFWGGRDGDSYAFQVPLFWHFASERDRSSTYATPVGYYHRDADGWSAGVGPLLPLLWLRSGEKRSHAVLFPIFWRFRDDGQQKATTVVGPYWHRSWGGETTDALFPLLHYRRGARPGGTDETSFTLFPLVHYHRDQYTRVIATPLFASARGPRRAAGFAGPYLWYKDQQLDASFVPFLYADVTRHDTGERSRQWGLWFAMDGPGHRARALFPLFGRYTDEKESDTYVFPTYFRQRKTDGSKVDTLLPIFWRSSGDGRSTTVVLNWYDRTSPGVHNTGLVPLWFHARNTERSLTVIPPLLFVRRHDYKADSERLWCLLLWHKRDGADSSTTVFPVWWSKESKGKGYAVLFPVFWRFHDDSAQSTSTYAFPIYWSSWGTGRTRGLPPLFWYSRNPADGSGSTAILPLFYEAHGPKKTAFMTALGGYQRTESTRLMYAGPLVPFWFSFTRTPTETQTNFFLPLLYFSRTAPDSSLRTVLGLFWRHHDVVSSTTVAVPLFYDIHDYHLSRTTILIPFFVRHANEVEHSTTLLAPLFYRRTSPDSSTTVAFPLVWDFKTGNDRTTLVLPFVARWRRPTHVSTWVFPTIYHRTGLAKDGAPDGTWRTIVAPFWDASVKRPGDFAWDVLGGLFGHERVGRNRYLKIFFIRFEQEPAPRAQTAWYSQPARTPRKEASRGLSMNTW
jgi:hypothetical protein